MQKNKSIVQMVSTFMVLLILLAIGSLGYLLISDKYTRFHQEMDTFQREFTDRQKMELKNQVDQAIEYIDHQLSQAENVARRKMKQRVATALQIATSIYKTHRKDWNDAQIKQQIKTTLGAVRFDQGRGYYYIFDADGVFLLNPNLPTVEGHSLSELENGQELMTTFQKIVSGSGEGFNTYRFHKPGGQNPKEKSEKIAFIKHFAPYNWYLGTGIYLNSMEKEIQNQVNDYLNIHRFGLHNQNYVFVIKLLNINGGKDFGIMYANASRPDLIGKYISDDVADAKGKFFRREFLQGLRNKGQCYVSYWYKKVGSDLRPQLKVSFFKLYKKADLIVAAGTYYPDMEKVIADYHQRIAKNVTKDVRNIIIILLLVFTILLLIIRFMSSKIRHQFTVFNNFFAEAAQKNRQIDNRSLSLKEFQDLATTVNHMISKRQLIEESLHDSEEKFRTLAVTSPTAIFIHQQGTFVYANPAAIEISGYKLEELLQMKFWELVHPDIREMVKNFGIQREAGKEIPQRYEMKIITKQGNTKWIDFNAATIDYHGKPAIMGNAIDITDRKQSEQDLLAEKEQFRVLAATSPSAIFIHQQKTYTYVNPAYCQLTGFSEAELLQMNFWEVVHPNMREMIKKYDLRRKGGQAPLKRFEVKILTKKGAIKWLDFSAELITYQGKKATIGNAIDITERKIAKQELEAEKERLAVTLSSIGDGVIATDLSGKITLINGAAEQITGWKENSALDQNLTNVLSLTTKDNGNLPLNLLQQVKRTGAPYHRQEQVSIRTKDGEEKIIADSAAPIQGQDGKMIGIIIVIRDVTEKVRTSKELETAQKLESIGLLAGGIAHDFNNLLTAIYGNISLAKMYPDDQHKVFHYLDKTENSLSQAKGLTQQLLTFAKGGAPVKQLANIGTLLEEVAKFSLRGSKIHLQVKLANDLWSASIDTGQFSQVINNLVINANQAMPDGGTLTIKAENIFSSPKGMPPGRQKDPYIKISVADQGIGISEKHLDKIFDPYFTTKHEGSGLGLATVYSIIKNHHGRIQVQSTLGTGTTFTIFLPAAKSATQTNQDENKQKKGSQSRSGRILIMDDEEIIREICGEMLMALGHTVDYAADGQETLEKYQQAMKEGKPFDLVIMDLTIPGGMGGKEVIKKVLEIDPQAKAIVSSGYSQDDVMANYRNYGFCGVAAKPYLISDLDKILQKLLR